MGSTQTTNNHHKRYRNSTSTKSIDNTKRKRVDRFRTTMRSITLRALAARNYHNIVSSSNSSTINNNPYISDFDYRKLSTLTGLSETKINELHREFLILSDNGRLSYERYKSMLETVPIQRTSIELDTLARQTFTLFDKDGNNYLDFAEFIAAYITMEKNELCLNDKSIHKKSPMLPTHPTITSVTRQATTYYSPQRNLINTSPIISHHHPTYLLNKHTSYHSQPSEHYIYVSPQHTSK